MKYNQYTSCRLKVPAKMAENIGNFDNKELSIAIFICTCKSHVTILPVKIS
jgi:hypothetical protein